MTTATKSERVERIIGESYSEGIPMGDLTTIAKAVGCTHEYVRQIAVRLRIPHGLELARPKRFCADCGVQRHGTGDYCRKHYWAHYDPAPFDHGKRNAYNRGCRCPECTEAVRLHSAAWRAAHLHKKPPEHGTTHSYGKYGCRCELCTAANTAASKRYYHRNKRA